MKKAALTDIVCELLFLWQASNPTGGRFTFGSELLGERMWTTYLVFAESFAPCCEFSFGAPNPETYLMSALKSD